MTWRAQLTLGRLERSGARTDGGRGVRTDRQGTDGPVCTAGGHTAAALRCEASSPN